MQIRDDDRNVAAHQHGNGKASINTGSTRILVFPLSPQPRRLRRSLNLHGGVDAVKTDLRGFEQLKEGRTWEILLLLESGSERGDRVIRHRAGLIQVHAPGSWIRYWIQP